MFDRLSWYASSHMWVVIPAVGSSVLVANQIHNCLGKIAKIMPVMKNSFAIAYLMLLGKGM